MNDTKKIPGHAYAYPVWQGCSVKKRITDLESEGDAIVSVRRGVPVPVCEGHSEVGDQVISVRFTREEMARYTREEREAFARIYEAAYTREALRRL